MTTFLDYFIPAPGRGVMLAATMTEKLDIKQFGEDEIDESVDELLGQDLIVTYERPYYSYRNSIPELEHVLQQYNVKNRWLDIFSEVRKATGKQIALSKIIKSTISEEAELKITRLGNSYGDPEYRPNLDQKVEDRLRAVKELFDYILQHEQISYEQNETTYWAEIIINESPILGDD